jgi:pimeloyl-ACP methyl ester carboxylesterase
VACGASRRVTPNGPALELHEWGASGRVPALLLHSLAAHAHWWDWVAPALASRFHVVAVDFRGHGGSDHVAPAAYGFADYADDVDALLTHLGWTAPLIVGHSMGGYVGALHAARRPERVGALVIADMLTGWSDAMAERARAQASRDGPTFASAQDAGARFRLAPPDTTAPRERLEHVGEMAVTERRPGVWDYRFDRQVFLHPPPDPRAFLSDVGAPTLVMRGEKSSVMSADAAAGVAKRVRFGEVREIAGAFHHLVLDAPEAFADAVLRWVDRVGGRDRY